MPVNQGKVVMAGKQSRPFHVVSPDYEAAEGVGKYAVTLIWLFWTLSLEKLAKIQGKV